MIGLGIAGGLVPSPTALLVLLGAIAFGRTAFGVALVLAYGLGMAATLTAAGLLLVRVRHSVLDRPAFTRLRAALPLTTSGLILLVGLGMAVRAGAAVV
jgi:ABC-type nickel/cobalt efflux system permease component RcnA